MAIEDTDRLGWTLQDVAQQLTVLQAQHKEHLIATKGRFNLFTLLLGIGDETRLHSRYIAHLLDPQGSHDCGPLFLKLFLKVLEGGVQPHEEQAKLNMLLNGFDLENVTVGCEVSGDEGRLDILIESPRWGAIAIENKIWAYEQDRQIERYATYLKRYYRCVLLYLTLDGKESQTASGCEYYRISYHEHILKWLEECLRATYPHVNINQALQQYKNVVCELVRRPTLETEYMEKMKEVVRTHPDIVANWSALKQAVEELREEYRNTLLDELKTQLRRNRIESGTPFQGAGGPKSCDWYITKASDKPKFGNADIDIRIQADWSGGGLELRNGVTEEAPGLYQLVNDSKFVKSAGPELKYSEGDGWNGGCYDVADGDCLSDEKLTRLLEAPKKLQEEVLRKIVSGWVSRISEYVDTIISVCNQGTAGTGSTPLS